MLVRKHFPHSIKVVEHAWIELGDGTRLAARLWMPRDAGKVKYPALLEYHPYRKRDGTALRDESTHHYFAGYGYVSIRVDVRGTGDSDGLMGDEYCQQEIDDAVEVIAWIANQTWCTGDVGMFGLSWGGINTLATASRNPPALKAIISQGSTDDRYQGDCHFQGGCMVNEHIGWGATMLSFFSWPADPLLVGDAWREDWLRRLTDQSYPLVEWMRHPSRDRFWRHSSVCEAPQKMKTPLLYLGGWLDPYADTAFRLIENYDMPLKVIVGPWAHTFPHFGSPQPAIGYLQEALTWWDYWLKGRKTGAMREPLLRYYLMDGAEFGAGSKFRKGRWRTARNWPPKGRDLLTFGLSEGSLISGRSANRAFSICSPMQTGVAGGEYCPMAWGADLPGDQRCDDAGSLCFDSGVLNQAITLVGSAHLDLTFTVDRPVAFVAARLCDVNPSGFSTRVALGLCNLNHLRGPEKPLRLRPGEEYKIRVRFEHTAFRIPKGHQLRLALSTQYWPLVMPSPQLVTLTVYTKSSRLSIPQLRGRNTCNVNFAAPEVGPTAKRTIFAPAKTQRSIRTDVQTGRTTYEVCEQSDDVQIQSHGARTFNRTTRAYTIDQGDPASAVMSSHRTRQLSRATNFCIRTEASTQLSCTKKTFELIASLEAFENDKLVFERRWRKSFPRGCH